MLRLHQRLISLRRRKPWLAHGAYEQLRVENDVLVYRMTAADGSDAVTVVLNVGDGAARLHPCGRASACSRAAPARTRRASSAATEPDQSAGPRTTRSSTSRTTRSSSATGAVEESGPDERHMAGQHPSSSARPVRGDAGDDRALVGDGPDPVHQAPAGELRHLVGRAAPGRDERAREPAHRHAVRLGGERGEDRELHLGQAEVAQLRGDLALEGSPARRRAKYAASSSPLSWSAMRTPFASNWN